MTNSSEGAVTTHSSGDSSGVESGRIFAPAASGAGHRNPRTRFVCSCGRMTSAITRASIGEIEVLLAVICTRKKRPVLVAAKAHVAGPGMDTVMGAPTFCQGMGRAKDK